MAYEGFKQVKTKNDKQVPGLHFGDACEESVPCMRLSLCLFVSLPRLSPSVSLCTCCTLICAHPRDSQGHPDSAPRPRPRAVNRRSGALVCRNFEIANSRREREQPKRGSSPGGSAGISECRHPSHLHTPAVRGSGLQSQPMPRAGVQPASCWSRLNQFGFSRCESCEPLKRFS